MPKLRSALLLGLLCSMPLLALPGPRPARAQHGLPPAGPPLHVLLAESDLLVWAEVSGVEESRLELVLRRALRGEPEQRFRVKRAPTRPPPLASGDHALLLLRGARPPYILTGRPEAVLHTSDPVEAADLAEALGGLDADRDDPGALAAHYQAWLDRDLGLLHPAARNGLGKVLAEHAELRLPVSLLRASAAAKRSNPLEGRRISAELATTTPEGAARLVSGLASGDGPDDPAVTLTALRSGGLHAVDGLLELFRQALASPVSGVSQAALHLAAPMVRLLGEPARDALLEAAESHPDPEIREASVRALERIEAGAG